MFTKRMALLALVIVAVAALAVACGGGGATSGGGNDITVTATDFKFDPAAVTVKAGQQVTVTLVNKGSTTHSWLIENMANTKVQADAGQTAKVTFTAPAAGTYKTLCDIPGHAEQGMVGQFVAQ